MWSIQSTDYEVTLYKGDKKIAKIVCGDPMVIATRLLVCLNHCHGIKTEKLIGPPICGYKNEIKND